MFSVCSSCWRQQRSFLRPIGVASHSTQRARRAVEACVAMDNDLEVRTMHVFISRALQKVLKEAPKKQTQLREACKTVIGAFMLCLERRRWRRACLERRRRRGACLEQQ